ncbi:MAG: hypothetical protein ABEN55_08750, partial [Bradymonadaceae bacterium]
KRRPAGAAYDILDYAQDIQKGDSLERVESDIHQNLDSLDEEIEHLETRLRELRDRRRVYRNRLLAVAAVREYRRYGA